MHGDDFDVCESFLSGALPLFNQKDFDAIWQEYFRTLDLFIRGLGQ